MIRAIVVDDEALSRELVLEFLAKEDDVELVGACANGFEAVKAVSDGDPDVMFLDVQMPKLDGFEVLELLDREPLVVFVTAYDEYAIRAFEARALDYLLKPFTEERFREAMSRVRERLRAGGARERVASHELRQRPHQRILVRLDEGRIEVVPVSRIDYIEAQDDAVVIVSGETRLRKPHTLGELERDLDPARFVRIHRSYLLNLDRLARVVPYAKDSRIALLRDGTKLPLSRSGYARLRELL